MLLDYSLISNGPFAINRRGLEEVDCGRKKNNFHSGEKKKKKEDG